MAPTGGRADADGPRILALQPFEHGEVLAPVHQVVHLVQSRLVHRRISAPPRPARALRRWSAPTPWSRISARSRSGATAAPSTRSASPYIGDESKRLAPAPSAHSTIARAFVSAAAPRTSNVRHVPMPMTGTSKPVAPSVRLSIVYSTGCANAESSVPSPQFPVPSPSSRTPNPEPRARAPRPRPRTPEPRAPVPSPEPRIPSPESRTPSPEPRSPKPPVHVLRQRR